MRAVFPDEQFLILEGPVSGSIHTLLEDVGWPAGTSDGRPRQGCMGDASSFRVLYNSGVTVPERLYASLGLELSSV